MHYFESLTLRTNLIKVSSTAFEGKIKEHCMEQKSTSQTFFFFFFSEPPRLIDMFPERGQDQLLYQCFLPWLLFQEEADPDNNHTVYVSFTLSWNMCPSNYLFHILSFIPYCWINQSSYCGCLYKVRTGLDIVLETEHWTLKHTQVSLSLKPRGGIKL